MTKNQLSEINEFHIRNVDKLYRMYGGLSSHLDAYTDGTIFLTIHRAPKWPKSDEVTARQLANAWRNSNLELAEAEKYYVRIIRQQSPTGFVFPIDIFRDNDTVREFDMAIEQLKAVDDSPKEELGIVLTGHFVNDEKTNS